ncbi:MAG: DUF6525 family protein [Pseudomonadota bacterium]
MSGNLGSTSLRRKRRTGNSMQTYDGLPAPLRLWLAEAVLPWSPSSAERIWARACAKGSNIEEALATLTKAEERTLAREAQSIST